METISRQVLRGELEYLKKARATIRAVPGQEPSCGTRSGCRIRHRHGSAAWRNVRAEVERHRPRPRNDNRSTLCRERREKGALRNGFRKPETAESLIRQDSAVYLAGKCRNRTYQPPCEGLSGFEDRARHQSRTLPRTCESMQLLSPRARDRSSGRAMPDAIRHGAEQWPTSAWTACGMKRSEYPRGDDRADSLPGVVSPRRRLRARGRICDAHPRSIRRRSPVRSESQSLLP